MRQGPPFLEAANGEIDNRDRMPKATLNSCFTMMDSWCTYNVISPELSRVFQKCGMKLKCFVRVASVISSSPRSCFVNSSQIFFRSVVLPLCCTFPNLMVLKGACTPMYGEGCTSTILEVQIVLHLFFPKVRLRSRRQIKATLWNHSMNFIALLYKRKRFLRCNLCYT